MKFSRIVIVGIASIAGLGVVTSDPALARAKHKQKIARHCVDQPSRGPTFYGFLFNPPPEPNGCAPPVYYAGRYIGQDPDPRIRFQLFRDPDTGYTHYH